MARLRKRGLGQLRAEDVAEEALLRGFDTAARKGMSPAECGRYVWTIATNLVTDGWRREKLHRELLVAQAGWVRVQRGVRFSPEDRVLAKERLARAKHLIEELPTAQREVCLLTLGDWSVEEIAEIRGVSRSTIRSQLAAAIRTLREWLAEGS